MRFERIEPELAEGHRRKRNANLTGLDLTKEVVEVFGGDVRKH